VFITTFKEMEWAEGGGMGRPPPLPRDQGLIPGRFCEPALVSDLAAVRVLGSASLRAGAGGRLRVSSRSEATGWTGGTWRTASWGRGRPGWLHITALVCGRSAVRLLGSASLRAGAVGHHGASSQSDD
jgi:hypothetical protein